MIIIVAVNNSVLLVLSSSPCPSHQGRGDGSGWQKLPSPGGRGQGEGEHRFIYSNLFFVTTDFIKTGKHLIDGINT